MTFPKKTITAVVISLVILFVIYNARVAIINNVIKKELAPFQSSITCANFRLTTSLQLKISHLCLQTPKAEITINDMTLTFDLASSQKIKRINIANLSIKGTNELFELPEQQENTPTLTKAKLQSQLQQLAIINAPFDLMVSSLSYLPYFDKITHENIEKQPYTGSLSLVSNTLTLTLKDAQENVFININISTKNRTNQVTAKLSSNIKPLIDFALKHKLPISPRALAHLHAITATGLFNTEVNYQKDLLSLNGQLKNLKLMSADNIAAIMPIAISGELDINSEINLAHNTEINADNTELELVLNFAPKSKIMANFNQQSLLDYVNQNSFDAELKTLIVDNPITQLSVQPKGELRLSPNQQVLTLSSINIEASNNLAIHHIELSNDTNESAPSKKSTIHSLNIEDIELNFKTYIENSSNKNQTTNMSSYAKADFVFKSPLLISSLNSLTQAPVEFNLHGRVEQSHQQTSIAFIENSTITSNNITIAGKSKADKSKSTQSQIKIKKIENKLLGEIHIQDSQNIRFNVSIKSQADNLRAANIIDINNLTINSGITGELSDIKISTNATADNVLLANMAVSGSVDKPTITITANQLPLTDLLALKIKLPAKIALVEGALSYSIKGQITDFNNIQNTPLAIAVAVTSLSGEIEGIWVQELYWQQNFNYLASKLTTVVSPENDSKDSKADNLTVALIETATPIAKLSFNTHISYEESFNFSASKLKGDILGGSFSIPTAQWPIKHGHSVDVQLSSIDLEQVLALDKKQGVVVTGEISGQLPIKFNGEKFTMEQGELHNVSNGLIQVINNPAVESLKTSNTQLKLAFDALQNLHYHQLSSDVSMADDGYMLLKTVIKGRNPDIDNDVNLNLNLSYDLQGLLESMSITDKFEERIIKGLQKN